MNDEFRSIHECLRGSITHEGIHKARRSLQDLPADTQLVVGQAHRMVFVIQGESPPCKFSWMKKGLALGVQNELIELFIERRKKLGLSHEKLAALAGIHRTAVSHIENHRRNPTVPKTIDNHLNKGCGHLRRQPNSVAVERLC
jgi:DNA-binding XRE family transcriptional regulator